MALPFPPHHRVRGLAIVAALLVLLAFGAGQLAAHAVLVSSDPPDGASLADPPRLVTLTFSEDVSPELSSASVTDQQSHKIPVAVHIDPEVPAKLVVELPDIGSGTYRVTWTAVSAVDLHVVSGWTVFAVGAPAADLAPGQSTSAVAWLDGFAAWVLFASVAVATGMLVMVLYLLPGTAYPSPASLRPRLRQIGLVSLVGALVAGAGGAALATREIAVAMPQVNPISAFFETPSGARWLAQEGLLLVALAGVLAWRPTVSRSRPALVASALALLAVLGVRALGAHQAAAPGSTLIDTVAWTAHSVAAAIWVGTLVVIGLTLVMGRHDDSTESPRYRVLRRFSPLAAVSVAVLAITGLYAAGRLVASVDALLFTDYGHLLIAKVALGTAVALLGFRHALRLHGWIRHVASRVSGSLGRRAAAMVAWGGTWRMSLRLEALGGLGVILVAALLSAAPPADGPEFRPLATRPAQDFVATVDDLLVTATVSPGRAGANFVNLGVFDTRRPALEPIERVDVTLRRLDGSSPPIALVGEPVGDGRYETPAGMIPMAGGWELSVNVVRPGLPTAVFRTPVDVGAAQVPVRAVVVSNAPLESTLTLIAVVLALGLGLAIAVVARRTRARRAASEADLPAGSRPVRPRPTC